MSATPYKAWRRLDNAAKIFPPTSDNRDPKVIRFACELNEEVCEQTLQQATEQALKEFPAFRCILRSGFFWYYLEDTQRTPTVHPENKTPCSTNYLARKRLLFDVSYFKCRINLEIYHALTDGTGAIEFLRTIVCRYLALRHPDVFGQSPSIPLGHDPSITRQSADSFDKYYQGRKGKRHKKKMRACQVSGTPTPEGRLAVIEGVFPVDVLLHKAREMNTTITGLLCAILMQSIQADLPVRKRHRPVVIAIPVNLRKYFESGSARNFFSIALVSYNFSKMPDHLETIVQSISMQLARQLTRENLQERLNELAALEHAIWSRIVPLPIKNFFMSMAYKFAMKQQTSSLSNLGVISLPEEFMPYIRRFDVFYSGPEVKACMCSFNNKMTVSFSSGIQNTDVQRRFFTQLVELGIPVEIYSNSYQEEDSL